MGARGASTLRARLLWPLVFHRSAFDEGAFCGARPALKSIHRLLVISLPICRGATHPVLKRTGILSTILRDVPHVFGFQLPKVD